MNVHRLLIALLVCSAWDAHVGWTSGPTDPAKAGTPTDGRTRGPTYWPQWRGPQHDGSIAGEHLIEKFPAEGPPVLWIRELGQGYSGLAVVDGRVYTMAQTLYEQQLVCLDGKTGSTLWTTSVGW